MPKIDKGQYTKEEWRKIKEQRHLEKQKPQEIITPNLVTHEDSLKNYLLCLKHGTKYGPEYVNKLYNMVKRNCSLDYEFVCLTDNAPAPKASSMVRSSICLMVTASRLMPTTQAVSQGAGQRRPVNSGKLLVACRRSIA